MKCKTPAVLLIALILAACSSAPPKLPYPAYVEVDLLTDIFMATLPGVRAKQLAGDPKTRRTSNRIDLPRNWVGTSGGEPGRSLELFVLQGELTVADIVLHPGGYAFLPAGSLGFNLAAKNGARILYFLNDTDIESVIRSPIIIDSDLLPWSLTATPGVDEKELRNDPGNGAKTWLVRIAAAATLPWETSTARREGYLMIGSLQLSECVDGVVHTAPYASGGYFFRAADTMNGGPESRAETVSVWFLRETEKGVVATWPHCTAAPEQEVGKP